MSTRSTLAPGEWTCTCEGVVVELELRDIDKTGRGRRHMVHVRVRPETVTVEADEEVELDAIITFVEKDGVMRRIAEVMPRVGDRVRAVGHAWGGHPSRFRVSALTVLREGAPRDEETA